MRNRALQLLLMIGSLDRSVISERRQTAIAATIGMHCKDHALGAVQAHGFADLFDNELSIPLHLRRCQAFCSARKLDRINLPHPNTVEKFSDHQIESLIE